VTELQAHRQPAPELGLLLRRAQSEQRLPSVSAAVVRAGEVIWAEAIGLADAERGAEASPETQYRIGSITKTFTAAAVMRLRDEGALSLDDPLAEHLPEVGQAGPTLRELLTHTSGLQAEIPGEVWETLDLPSADGLLARLSDVEQILEPGRHWHYSNLAFALLGVVVTRRSGTPYDDYIARCLLDPVGLRRTTWRRSDPSAKGYFVEPHQDVLRRDADDFDLQGAGALGALWSTSGDLARWAAFLADPDPGVLEPATVEEMRSLHTMRDLERWTQGWGLGLALYRVGERVFVGHGGSMPGHLACFVVSVPEQVGAVALTNATSEADTEGLALALAAATIEALPAEPDRWQPGEPPPVEEGALLGRWWCLGFEYVFSHRAGRLEMSPVGAAAERDTTVFVSEGRDRFRAVSGHHRGELLRVVREGGQAVKLYLATYPFERTPGPYAAARDS
jgi:CubicO group peptidase (beta-lactamase class C family)